MCLSKIYARLCGSLTCFYTALLKYLYLVCAVHALDLTHLGPKWDLQNLPFQLFSWSKLPHSCSWGEVNVHVVPHRFERRHMGDPRNLVQTCLGHRVPSTFRIWVNKETLMPGRTIGGASMRVRSASPFGVAKGERGRNCHQFTERGRYHLLIQRIVKWLRIGSKV